MAIVVVDEAEGGIVILVLVAVVGVKEIEAPVLGAHDERTRGDGLGGIPHELSSDGVAVGGIQPLDTEKVVIDKTEVRRDLIILRLLIVHAAAKAVKGHRDNRITPCPTNGAVFGIVGDRPHTGLGLDERLVAVGVVFRHEVVNGGILVEIIGGVGLAFGGRAVTDVIVGIGNFICSDEFIADVVAVLLVIDKNTATTKEGSSPL